MKPGIKWLLGAAALAALVWGMNTYQGRLIAKGDIQGSDRVQAAWNADTYQRNLATGQANAVRQRAAEKVADEQKQREDKAAADVALARTAVRSLRAEVAQLQNDLERLAAEPASPATLAEQAATYRELFGESAAAYADSEAAYTVLAQEAESLRLQVIGLQQFDSAVCRSGEHQ